MQQSRALLSQAGATSRSSFSSSLLFLEKRNGNQIWNGTATRASQTCSQSLPYRLAAIGPKIHGRYTARYLRSSKRFARDCSFVKLTNTNTRNIGESTNGKNHTQKPSGTSLVAFSASRINSHSNAIASALTAAPQKNIALSLVFMAPQNSLHVAAQSTHLAF